MIILVGIVYLLFLQSPNVQDNLNRHAFKLNYAAFSNGIKFANYRFILNRTNENSDNGIDQWTDGEVGLDYNKFGFPIGINVSDKSVQVPLTANDCLQLWQFVLGPLKPEISLNQDKSEYWVSLNNRGNCEYRSENVGELLVNYDSNAGKVTLIDISS